MSRRIRSSQAGAEKPGDYSKRVPSNREGADQPGHQATKTASGTAGHRRVRRKSIGEELV